MPTLQENKTVWDDASSINWKRGGEQWSDQWGTSYMQWHGTILPRIAPFLPASSILEIAPGFGRWTAYLKDLCSELTVVDLSENCINVCRERVSSSNHINYYTNDGTSLDMIPDGTIDFIFSFDSFVHIEDVTTEQYVSQFAKKLSPDGAAFIHHSNLGGYVRQVKCQSLLSKIPKLFETFALFGVVEDVMCQWRAQSMTWQKMRRFTNEHGLECISQELISWSSKRSLVDCLSTIVKKGGKWHTENVVLRNPEFMNEASYLKKLSDIYDITSRLPGSGTQPE